MTVEPRADNERMGRALAGLPLASGRPWRAASILMVITAFVLGGVIAADLFPTSRGAWDQDIYHLRVVQQFASQWPTPDVGDYRSGSTPLYHLSLAAVSRWLSDDPRMLRAAGALYTLAMVGLAAWVCAGRVGAWRGFALALPLAASPYVFASGAWILPDNAGWLWLLVVMVIAWRVPLTGASLAVAGLALVLLVLTRQVHLWAASQLWLAALLPIAAPGVDPRAPMAWELSSRRVRLWGAAILASVPAFLAVAWFVHRWHGLVPPMFQGGAFDDVINEPFPRNSGGNPSVLTVILALAGIIGTFFVGFAWPTVQRLIRLDRALWMRVITWGLVGGVLAALPVSTYNQDAGRFTGVWDIARRTPVVAGRSLFLVAAAAWGAAIIGLWFSALSRRDRWMFLGAWAGFIAAQMPSMQAWQRYYEPFILLVFMLAAVQAACSADAAAAIRAMHAAPEPDADAVVRPAVPRWAAAGPVALALLLAAVTVIRLK